MAKAKIDDLGSLGVIEDLPDYTLPPEAFTSSGFCRFSDRKVMRMRGRAAIFGTPSIAPYWMAPVHTPGGVFWAYFGLTGAAAYASSTHAVITRASGAYTTTTNRPWNGGLLGGILVVTNSTDTPQYWSTPSLGTLLLDVPSFPASTTCRIIIPYKQYLMAMNLTESGTAAPHKVLWSHLADPGAMPTSWDITDATKDAGETELHDVNSASIMGAKEMGDYLYIYKQRSIWRCSPSGNAFIFNFEKVFQDSQIGLAATHAIASIPGKQEHLIYTGRDLMRHDGVEMKSILTDIRRRTLRTLIDSTNYLNSFMTTFSQREEIWFCYPVTGDTYCTKALVYNYETGVLVDRDLLETPFIAADVFDEDGSSLWSAATDTWAAFNGTWAGSFAADFNSRLLLADHTNTLFYEMEATNQNAGVDFLSYVERKGIPFVGQKRDGSPIVDMENRKVLSRIWLKMTGGTVTVTALAQDHIDGTVTYSDPMTFTPGTDRYVDLPTPLSGLLLGIRVESQANETWELMGYDLELEVLGEF